MTGLGQERRFRPSRRVSGDTQYAADNSDNDAEGDTCASGQKLIGDNVFDDRQQERSISTQGGFAP